MSVRITQYYITMLFLLFMTGFMVLVWKSRYHKEVQSLKSADRRLSIKETARNALTCNSTVKYVLLELSEELIRSGLNLILTQTEDLSEESNFVESVFMNIDESVTRVGVFGEHFDLLNTAIRNLLKYCPNLQRKDILMDDPRTENKTKNSRGKITTHVFLIIPLNYTTELEVSSNKQLFNWKRIHFQILHKRGVSSKDQPQAYRWIGEEPDDALIHKRPSESYEAFTTRPIRDVRYKNIFVVPRDKRFFVWEKEAAEFKECPVHSEADKRKSQRKTKGRKLTDTETIRKYMTSIMAVKRLMQKHRMHSWLNCGTLLGWYRQCSLIPGDPDIDLMHFIKSDLFPRIHDDILKQKDVFLILDKNIILGNHPRGIYWELVVNSSDITVDVYMIESHKIFDPHSPKVIEFTDKICSTDLHGYRVYVLCTKYRDILRINYGDDIMTPK